MFDKIIFEKIMKWSENRPQPKGLTNETIKRVSDYFKENFNSSLPQGYMEFLNVMNGFSYDGHSIFCCYNDEIEKNYPRYASLDLVTLFQKILRKILNSYKKYGINILSGAQETFEALGHFLYYLEV